MTTAQVVEMSVTVNNNSAMTPGFKHFTYNKIIIIIIIVIIFILSLRYIFLFKALHLKSVLSTV